MLVTFVTTHFLQFYFTVLPASAGGDTACLVGPTHSGAAWAASQPPSRLQRGSLQLKVSVRSVWFISRLLSNMGWWKVTSTLRFAVLI